MRAVAGMAVCFLWHFPGVAPAGRYPAPCPVQPGLSSTRQPLARTAGIARRDRPNRSARPSIGDQPDQRTLRPSMRKPCVTIRASVSG